MPTESPSTSFPSASPFLNMDDTVRFASQPLYWPNTSLTIRACDLVVNRPEDADPSRSSAALSPWLLFRQVSIRK